MSRFLACTARAFMFAAVVFTLAACASHQDANHPGLETLAKEIAARVGPGDRVLLLGLSGADGQGDRLAARTLAFFEPLLARAVKKSGAAWISRGELASVMRMWRLDLAGVGRHPPGAASLMDVNVVVRGVAVRDGIEVRTTLRADDIATGRVIFADRDGWVETERLPRRAAVQERYDSQPYRTKSVDGRLEFWSGSPAYDPGSDMHFFFKVARKGYVTIFEINSAGQKRVIYPNTFQPKGFCTPGFAWQVPSVDAPFSISATLPPGSARYVAVLTGRPGIAEIGMGEHGPAFTDLIVQGAIASAAIRVRIE